MIWDEGRYLGVQCKTGRLVRGAVFFATCSRTGNVNKDYREDGIDLFGVYCPQTDEVYLVPIDDVPSRAAHLRSTVPRNGQRKGIRWASDYLLG